MRPSSPLTWCSPNPKSVFNSRLICSTGHLRCDVSTLFRTKNLIGFSGRLRDQRSEVAMRRMTPLAVIEHLTICQHRHLGLRVRLAVLQIHPCGLAGVPAALRPCVIPTVALTAPPRLHPVRGPEWRRAVGAIRTATLRRHEEARCGLPLTAGPRHRLLHPRCPPVVSSGPPDHGTRAHSQDASERHPACTRRERRHVANGHGVWCWHRQRAVALRRRHRRRRPCGPRRLAWARGLAAPGRWRPEAAQAAPAPLQSVLRQPRRATARAVGATPWGARLLYGGLPLLRSVRWGPGGPAAPRAGAAARPPEADTGDAPCTRRAAVASRRT